MVDRRTPGESPRPSKRLKVYVSFSDDDAPFANALMDAVATDQMILLSHRDFQAPADTDVAATRWADETIEASDAMIAILGPGMTVIQREELLSGQSQRQSRFYPAAALTLDDEEAFRSFRRFVPQFTLVVAQRPSGRLVSDETAEEVRKIITERWKPEPEPTAAPLAMRVETLDDEQASLVLGGAESLLAEAEHLLAEGDEGVPEVLLIQLEHDIRLVRTALASPLPDTVTIERAFSRISQTLAGTQPTQAQIADELKLAGIPTDDAQAVATGITEVTDLVSRLGSESDETDVAIAREMQLAIERIEERLGQIATPDGDGGVEVLEPKERIRDAKFRGREKFWSELWPEQKAKIIGRLVSTGMAVSGGAIVSKLGVPASILHLAKALLKNVFT